MTNRKPEWLHRPIVSDPNVRKVEEMLRELNLNTVCHEAACPNSGECFARKNATFMIMGAKCTRACAFCNVASGMPQPLDPGEPARVARACGRLGLRYAVITSVTRDDLPDGGAAHFAATVRAVKDVNPGIAVETLVPDFQGSEASIIILAESSPDVISHNVETVKELYHEARAQADYARSLAFIKSVRRLAGTSRAKSGFMVGLGETPAQVYALMDDLREAGCEFLTIGQYLSPSPSNLPVREYVTPERFSAYREAALERGFAFVASAPYVRSSYNAVEALEASPSRA